MHVWRVDDPEAAQPSTFQVPGVDKWLTTIAPGTVGVTTAGISYNHHPHPGIRYLHLSDAALVTVYLVWPISPSHPATDDFRRLVQRQLASQKLATKDR